MTTAVSPRPLIDTNILVYAEHRLAPQHATCKALLKSCEVGDIELSVAPQNLAEYYATVTNAKRVSPPLSPEEASLRLRSLLITDSLHILPTPIDITERALSLLEVVPAISQRFFDLQIVATMMANRVSTIYTYNTCDFQPFSDLIEVARPPALVRAN